MKWTADEEKAFAALFATGVSFRVLGAHFGRSGEAAYRKAMQMGLGSKPLQGNRSPTWAALVALCADRKPRTVHQLAEATGAARRTLDQLLRDRERAGKAHVARRARRQGRPIPYWLPFPGKSAPAPRRRTVAENGRNYYRRLKEQDPIGAKLRTDRNTLRRAEKRGTVPRQHLAVRALFGQGNGR
ncbi:hypothetical protein [Cupriavidus pauculus]|uniref:hypothetical protein n=1 Tax=Cupriavidus pauculus TaxID=82633 RepID=UPI001FD4F78B|nr:hypothetical protein [Cupriavidus pauculus]